MQFSKIVKCVLCLANLSALGFSAIKVKGCVYSLCFLEVNARAPEIKSPSANGHTHLVIESKRVMFLLLVLTFKNTDIFRGR